MKTIDLSFKARGLKVYVYEINKKTIAALEKNNEEGEDNVSEILDELCVKNVKVINGIEANNPSDKMTLKVDGKNLSSDILPVSSYDDLYESEIFDSFVKELEKKGSNWSKLKKLYKDSLEEGILVNNNIPIENLIIGWQNIPVDGGSMKSIPKDHDLVFEVIEYQSGQLNVNFDVDDDFNANQLTLVRTALDEFDDELSNTVYSEIYDELKDYHPDADFDENDITAVKYKDKTHWFELDFQGGGDGYYIYLKHKDNGDWFWDVGSRRLCGM